MGKRGADSQRAIVVREKMLLLGLINTRQPVKVNLVVESLSKDFDPRRLRRAVDALRRQGMLMKVKGGQYVVTRRGRDALGTGRYAIQRDIGRMSYLYEGSKGGRERP